MRRLSSSHLFMSSVAAVALAAPVSVAAQDAPADEDNGRLAEIVVTAEKRGQNLEEVPLAISAVQSEELELRGLTEAKDLSAIAPNVAVNGGTTNATAAVITIRGIPTPADETQGFDSPIGLYVDGVYMARSSASSFEVADIERVEVLRGPQGTLFGRNATSGVVNIRTARPSLTGMAANAELEYGNYNSVKAKGMINVPLGEIAAVRVAGFYLNREGYTTNLFDNSKLDDRDMYGVRGSIRIEPSSGTTIDIMAQYFHEKDNRMRIQKQMCQRDPTGVMGCLAGSRKFETTNANTTFVGVLTSAEFFRLRGLPASFALGSLYGTDTYTGVVNPADYRTVNTDHTPSYYTQEWIIQGSIEQDLGGGLSLKLGGNYQKVDLDSSQDYNLSVQNRAIFAPALAALELARNGGMGAGLQTYLTPVYNAITPNGANGQLCTSLGEETGTGSFGGKRLCSMTPQDFDRSNLNQSSWTGEAIISSDFDGKVNFLLGGIYGKYHLTENSYYVSSFGIDYFTGILGAFTALGGGLAPGYLGTPTYRSNTDDLKIDTYGLFGEVYVEFNDKLKLTLGGRYNNDKKVVRARTTLASYLVPHGTANAYDSNGIFGARYDADPATACPAGATLGQLGSIAGCEAYQVRTVKFGEFTGRAVLNYKISDDSMIYVSYSRGYKSGGINPPLSPVFAVTDTFKPEFVNAFEIGSKNTFANGKIMLNITGFYYDYKDLQLSRIVARTSVNDNVSAKIYGLEAEAVLRPTDELTINMNASYLHTEVSQDKMLANPRDFGAGRADAVIIKDITNGANCAVSSNSGSAAGVNAYVNQVNTWINTINAVGNPLTTAGTGLQPGAGLQPTTAFPSGSGLNSTGAFGVCAILANLAGPVGGSFGGVTVHSAGIETNIKGNKLPGSPDYKFSAGVQYALPVGEMTVTPRADFVYTGKSYGNIFNGTVNEVPSFTQVNAQVQIDGPDKKWFARVWVQNLTDKDSITGLYVTDQSSGNYTNVFTLEPRRYGLTAGIKF